MLYLTSSSCEAFHEFFPSRPKMRIQLRAVVVSFNVAGLHPDGDAEEQPRDAKSLSIMRVDQPLLQSWVGSLKLKA